MERSSYDEVGRALSVLGTREGRREIYGRSPTRAGYDLLPAASWLLLRIKKYGWAEPALLAERSTVPLPVVMEAARQVEGRGLPSAEGLDLVLTDDGPRGRRSGWREAREESLAELLGDWWGPDRPTDWRKLVKELTRNWAAVSRRSARRQPEGPHGGTERPSVEPGIRTGADGSRTGGGRGPGPRGRRAVFEVCRWLKRGLS